MDEKISVVLPTYNEINNIKKLVSSVQQILNKITSDYEIIIVDDNSPDGTGNFMKAYSKDNEKIKVLIRKLKTGLGDAYRYGFQYITGDIIFQMDADLSHNPKEIPKFINALKYNDIVVGSRYIKGGMNLHGDKKRIIISKVANFLASFFIRLRQTDLTNGYRAYKRKVIDEIMPHVTCQNYVFLVEMLVKAKQFGFTIGEVPIKFQDRRIGKSKFNFREIFFFLRYLLKRTVIFIRT